MLSAMLTLRNVLRDFLSNSLSNALSNTLSNAQQCPAMPSKALSNTQQSSGILNSAQQCQAVLSNAQYYSFGNDKNTLGLNDGERGKAVPRAAAWLRPAAKNQL